MRYVYSHYGNSRTGKTVCDYTETSLRYLMVSYRLNLQIPQCTCPTSHNAPFKREICTFLFWMVHCGIWDRRIVGFVRLVSYCLCVESQPMQFSMTGSGQLGRRFDYRSTALACKNRRGGYWAANCYYYLRQIIVIIAIMIHLICQNLSIQIYCIISLRHCDWIPTDIWNESNVGTTYLNNVSANLMLLCQIHV